MKISSIPSLQPPYSEPLSSGVGLSIPWMNFFKTLFIRLNPLGIEQSFKFQNNKANQVVSGLQFDGEKVGYAIVEFLIKRISETTPFHGAGVELVEFGVLHLIYKPVSKTWVINRPDPKNIPANSGVTFSMSSEVAGQLLLSANQITGKVHTQNLIFRTRFLTAKG